MLAHGHRPTHPGAPCGRRPLRCYSAVMHHGNAGQVMSALNQRAISKDDFRLRVVKGCVNEAIQNVLGSHTTVQLQGSTAKGTAVQGNSDYDFFVRYDDTIGTVTRAQRMQIHDWICHNLHSNGISYRSRCGENIIHFWDGSDRHGTLPNADIVFEMFVGHGRIPPDNKALANSEVAQLVVRYIKMLPNAYKNLNEPTGFQLETAVKMVDQHLRRNGASMTGKDGFEVLMFAVLGAICSRTFNYKNVNTPKVDQVAGLYEQLQRAGVVNKQWSSVVGNVLDDRCRSAAGWLIVEW